MCRYEDVICRILAAATSCKHAVVLSMRCVVVGAGGCSQGLDALLGIPEPETTPLPDLMGAGFGEMDDLNEGDD